MPPPMPTIALPHPPRRILLVKPSALGDVVHALPVLHLLKRRFPSARIDWLVGSAFAPLLDGHPDLSAVVPFDRKNPRSVPDLARRLGETGYDLAIDLQGLFRSGWLPARRGRRRGSASATPARGRRCSTPTRSPPRRGRASTTATRSSGTWTWPNRSAAVAVAGGVRLRRDGRRPRRRRGDARPARAGTGRSPCCCRGRTGRPSGGRSSRSTPWSSRSAIGSACRRSSPARATRGRWPGRST